MKLFFQYIYQMLVKYSLFIFSIHKKHNLIKGFWQQHRILIFCFVFTNTWFYSFTLFQIEFWSSASSLRILDFIHSPCPRLNFGLLLLLYEYLISFFFHPVPDWILIFYFVFTNTWFYSFTLSQIEFWSSALFLQKLDFIHSSCPRLNSGLLFRLYEHFISFS